MAGKQLPNPKRLVEDSEHSISVFRNILVVGTVLLLGGLFPAMFKLGYDFALDILNQVWRSKSTAQDFGWMSFNETLGMVSFEVSQNIYSIYGFLATFYVALAAFVFVSKEGGSGAGQNHTSNFGYRKLNKNITTQSLTAKFRIGSISLKELYLLKRQGLERNDSYIKVANTTIVFSLVFGIIAIWSSYFTSNECGVIATRSDNIDVLRNFIPWMLIASPLPILLISLNQLFMNDINSILGFNVRRNRDNAGIEDALKAFHNAETFLKTSGVIAPESYDLSIQKWNDVDLFNERFVKCVRTFLGWKHILFRIILNLIIVFFIFSFIALLIIVAYGSRPGGLESVISVLIFGLLALFNYLCVGYILHFIGLMKRQIRWRYISFDVLYWGSVFLLMCILWLIIIGCGVFAVVVSIMGDFSMVYDAFMPVFLISVVGSLALAVMVARSVYTDSDDVFVELLKRYGFSPKVTLQPSIQLGDFEFTRVQEMSSLEKVYFLRGLRYGVVLQLRLIFIRILAKGAY